MKPRLDVSREHLLYLRGVRKKNIIVNAIRCAVLVVFLCLWELSAQFAWINPFITSSPTRIVKTIADLYKNGSLFLHVGTTLWETLAGFAIAVVLGYSIALLLWWSDAMRRITEPYIVVLNALPKIALGPLIIIWCGTGSKAIVFMTVLIGLIVAILNMLNGFKGILVQEIEPDTFRLIGERKKVYDGSGIGPRR